MHRVLFYPYFLQLPRWWQAFEQIEWVICSWRKYLYFALLFFFFLSLACQLLSRFKFKLRIHLRSEQLAAIKWCTCGWQGAYTAPLSLNSLSTSSTRTSAVYWRRFSIDIWFLQTIYKSRRIQVEPQINK